jgi:hypothetical protein
MIKTLKKIGEWTLIILFIGFLVFWLLYFFPALGSAWNAAELY